MSSLLETHRRHPSRMRRRRMRECPGIPAQRPRRRRRRQQQPLRTEKTPGPARPLTLTVDGRLAAATRRTRKAKTSTTTITAAVLLAMQRAITRQGGAALEAAKPTSCGSVGATWSAIEVFCRNSIEATIKCRKVRPFAGEAGHSIMDKCRAFPEKPAPKG